MSDPTSDEDELLVALIDRHWRPGEVCADGDFIDLVRSASRRRAQREVAITLTMLIAATLLFTLHVRASPASADPSVWLDGTSLSSAKSPYDHEFAGLHGMFLAGGPQ